MIDYIEVFVFSDQPVTYSLCGARTYIILDLSHTQNQSQIHECLANNCSYLFVIQKDESIALGFYAQALFVLGLEKDLMKIASDDTLGRKLQDAKLLVKERAPKKST